MSANVSTCVAGQSEPIRRGRLRPALCVLLLAAGITGATLVAPPLGHAERFRGKRYVPNSSGSRAMGISRAKGIARRVIRHVFAVRSGTELYVCSRHSFRESGCDFQFISRFGNTTCGNAKVRAYRTRIVVYYDAYNTGCGDF